MIDIILLQKDKGGDPELVRESQRKRGASVELVDDVLERYTNWTKLNFQAAQKAKEINALQKEISLKKRNKEPADDLVAQKTSQDKELAELKQTAIEAEKTMRKLCGTIGNIVAEGCPISLTEDDNSLIRQWHPDGPDAQPVHRTDIIAHHEVLHRIDAFDLERGAKISGHRGFFLTGDGVDLNQALINYGLDFLRKKEYKKVQTPYIMKRDVMSKTAQLDQFDEELYKVMDGEEDKYLIATSEQPLSGMYMDEWFENPKTDLPLKFAGYSTCFRKEAGSHGRDVWGIFRVHQFEKIEQFCITEPEKSMEMFEHMVANSEEFYQSLGLPYRVVGIVSGALNNAAAIKYDVEAWFPFQGAYKELQSISNCTDYQSRSLEVRCGVKVKGETKKNYVHMLNGTLCATERALCCVVENYQTPDGLRIPEVLRPYMQGRDFLPWVKELPKNTTSKLNNFKKA
ncbi:seryl-trna synthetase [Phaffia rhodozyma]|uniref:serine--tRNA ligase n=1 Tax=Phaffia rhodozyma TaxID=264483 RepID=A0A0F7SQZ0_PHARH|nr:seryl-trna synthetase [Phaffia rhodozyma]